MKDLVYGIKIYQDENDDISFLFKCDDEEFMNEFSEKLYEFANKYNGRIEIEKQKSRRVNKTYILLRKEKINEFSI